MSASFMRASLPSRIRPVRWVTPIRVPALSNTSTNRMLNTMMTKVSSAAREKSNCSKVGASDGGIMREPERKPDQRHRQNTEQRAADDAPVIERGDQHETEQRQDRGGLGQIAERHQGRGMRGDHPGSLERDDAEEQAGARRDRELEVVRDRI